MKFRILLFLSLVLSLRGSGVEIPIAPDDSDFGRSLSHSWNSLQYPDWKWHRFKIQFILSVHTYSDGLWLHIYGLPKNIDVDDLSVRLLRNDLPPLLPSIEDLNPHGIVGAVGTYTQRAPATALFPWISRVAQPAWIEFRIAKTLLYLEIPTGLYMNPQESLDSPQVIGANDAPEKAKGSQFRGKILTWESVTYDFGTIQNGWNLTVNQKKNPHLLTEVQVSGVQVHAGPNVPHLLNTNGTPPEVSARLILPDGETFAERRISDRLVRNGDLSSYTEFALMRNGMSRPAHWAALEVSVNRKVFRKLVPPSIYW